MSYIDVAIVLLNQDILADLISVDKCIVEPKFKDKFSQLRLDLTP